MIFYIAGGTGGHLFPAIAIHQELELEAKFFVPRKNPAESILGIYKVNPIIFPFYKKEILLFPLIIFKVLRYILKYKPNIIVAMGGGVCIPFVLMAWVLRIPIILFEQNSFPGRAIRVCQFFADKIVTSFEITKKYLVMKKKVKCLGNPIRTKYPINDKLPNQWDSLDGDTLLVVGGSQGAKAINKFIVENKYQIMQSGWNIIHLMGEKYYNENPHIKKFDSYNSNHYIALPFLSNMNLAYKKATIVICRSGATTLAEVYQYELPALLIPYPYAKDDHQLKNAKDFSDQYNKVKILLESDLSVKNFWNIINELKVDLKDKKSRSSITTAKYICEFIKTYLK